MVGLLLMMGLFCFSGGCAYELPRSGEILEENLGIPVLFTYVDAQASAVCVAGSFNGWSAVSSCMRRQGDVWSLKMSLPQGRYEYLFVIDGRLWKPDPRALLAENSGFGNENSILIVE